jgi:hypothetical protein
MIDAVPPPPRVVIVESASTHQPTMFLGFMAVGDEAAMIKLERAAVASGLSAGRTKNDKDETEVMVVFPPDSDVRNALPLYRKALAGEFGKLMLEVTIVPVSAAADGIDLETEVSVEGPESIVVPQP